MKEKGYTIQRWYKNEDDIGVDTLSRLEMAFAVGATDREACHFARCSVVAFRRFEQKNEWYKEIKENLRESLITKARFTIADDIESVDTAKWFLQRRRKDEFSERVETTGKDGAPILVLPMALIEKNKLKEDTSLLDNKNINESTSSTE